MLEEVVLVELGHSQKKVLGELYKLLILPNCDKNVECSFIM
jgi:hypothetical protein